MSKAFDVSHKFLLYKLSRLGFCGTVLDWLSSFFQTHSQYFKIQNVCSSTKSVLSGVVQGSVLGPSAFSLIINDLTNCVKFSSPILYADDLKVVMPCNSVNDNVKLQSDIDRISAWLKIWGMSFNVSKCCVLHLDILDVNNVYTIDGVAIPLLTTYSYLGVKRDSDLLYVSHITSVTVSTHRLCAPLLRMFITRNSNPLKFANYTYVWARLDFASQVWSPHTKYLINHLERIQKLFTRQLRGASGLAIRKDLLCFIWILLRPVKLKLTE